MGLVSVPVRGAEEIDWKTGRELDLALLQTVAVSWQQADLRTRLERLAARYQVAIYLDRRVDPSQEIDFSREQVTLEQFLWELADQLQLGAARIENVYYLGPRETALTLPLLIESAQEERTAWAREAGWNQPRPLAWPRLATPDAVLNQLLPELGIELAAEAELPYDLWPAVSLPPLTGEARLGLLASGFNRWFSLDDDRRLNWVDWPEVEQGSTTLRPVDGAPQVARSLRTKFPNCRLRGSGQSLVVSGPPEEIASIRRAVVALQMPDLSGLDRQRYDLRTSAQRGSILVSIARQSGLELQYQPADRPVLAETIEINVQQFTLEQLLTEVLKGTGLRFEIGEGKLRLLR